MTGWVDVQVYGDTAGVQGMLARLDTALNPVAIAAFLGGPVTEFVQSRARSRFKTEGDDAVGGWAPLAPATQAIRAQGGYGSAHPINKRTGRLEDYIVGTPGAVTMHNLGATLTYPGTPPQGELKDKVQRAQMGRTSRDSRQGIPRPVLGLNERDLTAVLLMLAMRIKRGR